MDFEKTVAELCKELGVGNTPLQQTETANVRVFGKREDLNASGSVKDRPAVRMVCALTEKGMLARGGTLVEATSGNMGISLAYVGSKKGFNVVIVMPSNVSKERVALIESYGAKVVFSDAEQGMSGAVKVAGVLCRQLNAVCPKQFTNRENLLCHYYSTAEELLRQVCPIDYFVCGVGTGATLVGTALRLKEVLPSVKIVAVEPKESRVLAGGKSGKHGIQGIGANFVPPLYQSSVVDEVFAVSTDEAVGCAVELQRSGYFVGISSGANYFAVKQLARRKEAFGKTFVTVFADSGNRYSLQ